MIVSLKGRLEDVNENKIVLDVNGLGYELTVTATVLRALPPLRQELQLITYLHVRDDALILYGFSSWEERRLFDQVIGVAGIGPKTAVGVLSSISPPEFVGAVLHKQREVLTSLPGIGKKTAERIILELRDKFKQAGWEPSEVDSLSIREGVLEDAVEALIALGYNQNEAARMVRSVQHRLEERSDLQELLKLALAGNNK